MRRVDRRTGAEIVTSLTVWPATKSSPALIDVSNADPRSLQVLDNRYWDAPTIRCFTNGFDRTRMRFVGPMRKIESRRVHAALN